MAERIGIPLALRITIWRDDCEMCRGLLGSTDLVKALAAELDELEGDRRRSPAAQRA